MEHWTQTETPHTSEVEQGRLFAPPYESRLAFFEVRPAEWTHLCPCRFGEARESAVGTWSGDSYRYDLYAKGEGYGALIALRCFDGSGVVWLTAERTDRRNESSLLAMIADMPDEARRWDACHFLAETARRTAAAARLEERQTLFEAFCDGRLKKRRRGNVWRMEILPKMTQTTTEGATT